MDEWVCSACTLENPYSETSCQVSFTHFKLEGGGGGGPIRLIKDTASPIQVPYAKGKGHSRSLMMERGALTLLLEI